MKNSHKIVFWIIIAVFVLSSFLAFASFSFISQSTVNNTKNEPMIISSEEKAAQKAQKVEDEFGKNLEGVLQKLEPGKYDQGTHYLEVSGVMLALLESGDPGIDLAKYEGENVKVWGETVMTQKQDNVIMKVKRIEKSIPAVK